MVQVINSIYIRFDHAINMNQVGKVHKWNVQQCKNGCGICSFFLSFWFICKSNCKLSHNGFKCLMETNGSIKINEDITMNSNFDRVWWAGTLTAHTDTHTNAHLQYQKND